MTHSNQDNSRKVNVKVMTLTAVGSEDRFLKVEQTQNFSVQTWHSIHSLFGVKGIQQLKSMKIYEEEPRQRK